MSDLLIYPGTALKAVSSSDSTLTMEGYLVVFSDETSPDKSAERDFFNASTDFGYDELHEGKSIVKPAFYDHGLDPFIGRERIGSAEIKMDEVGLFAQYTIRKRRDYLQKVLDEDPNALGQSSGAVAHLTHRTPVGKSHHLDLWTLGEASLTPTPAEPRTTAMLKSLPVKALSLDAYAASKQQQADPYAGLKSLTDELRAARYARAILDAFPSR